MSNRQKMCVPLAKMSSIQWQIERFKSKIYFFIYFGNKYFEENNKMNLNRFMADMRIKEDYKKDNEY